jgi:anti-sigma factor RsiW
MVDAEDTAEPDPRAVADLSALADGTLDPDRVSAVRELIARSPELSRRYEAERRAVNALRAVRADRAPAQLRIAVTGPRRQARRSRSRLIYVGALSTAVAAAVAALVLLLPGGAPGAPSVSQAAALALRGPVMSAPAKHPGVKLNQDVEEVYFPDWSRLGWHAVGQRIDRLGGHRAVTVYYEWQGKRVAYTILAAPALPWPGNQTRVMHGIEFQSLVSGSRQIITWRRTGHTCVLSGSRIPVSELARLAAWK